MTALSSMIQKKLRKKEVFFDGFAVGEGAKKDELVACSSKNCVIVDGKLMRGVGVAQYVQNGAAPLLPTDMLVKMFLAWDMDAQGKRRERIGYITASNKAYVYLSETGAFSNIGTLSGGGAVVSALEKNGVYRTIFVCGTGIYRLEEKKLVSCSSIPCQAVACFGWGRVFTVSNDFYLVYSAPFAPTDYTENIDDSGKIALRHDCGKIVGLSMLRNRLCVLYEYGVSMLEIGGSARSFIRKDIEYSGGKIFGDTLCVANVQGEYAYFLAEDGIYRFDGIKMEKICKNLAIRAKENQPFGGAVFEGKYYVTFTNDEGAWKTVCVELESEWGYETFVMHGLTALSGKAICRYGTSILVLKNTGYIPSGEEIAFSVSKNNFSATGSKTLTALRFLGKGSFQLQVSAGKKTKQQTVAIQDGCARVPLNMRGISFSLRITPMIRTEIYNMTAEMQMLVK